MSRIERVAATRVTTPLHTPFVTALRRTTTTDTVVVRVTDSDGVTGWGEAPQVWQVTGESLAGAESCVTGPLATVVTGRDPDDLHAVLWDVGAAVAANHGAKAAVDVALVRPDDGAAYVLVVCTTADADEQTLYGVNAAVSRAVWEARPA